MNTILTVLSIDNTKYLTNFEGKVIVSNRMQMFSIIDLIDMD